MLSKYCRSKNPVSLTFPLETPFPVLNSFLWLSYSCFAFFAAVLPNQLVALDLIFYWPLPDECTDR